MVLVLHFRFCDSKILHCQKPYSTSRSNILIIGDLAIAKMC